VAATIELMSNGRLRTGSLFIEDRGCLIVASERIGDQELPTFSATLPVPVAEAGERPASPGPDARRVAAGADDVPDG